MADPLTSTIRLTQPTVGGDLGAWGGFINADLAYVDAAINGILTINVTGVSITLEALGDASDQARYQWYKFTGSPGNNCTATIPANQKVGIVTNSMTGGFNLILTTGSGTTVTVGPGQTFAFYCDGTNCGVMPWSTAGVLPALGVTGATLLNVGESSSFVEVTSGNPLTITLPTPVSNAGVWYHIYNAATGTTTISSGSGNFGGPSGSGTTSQTLATNTDAYFISDGTTWKVFGGAGSAGAFSTLNVTGSATFGGNVSITGTLSAGTVQGTSTVTAFDCTGIMQVTGSATFSSGAQVMGTLTASTLDVVGVSTFGSVAGNPTFGTNVTVIGTSTMGVLDVTGTSSQIGNASFGANVNVTGTLSAAGLAVVGTATYTNIFVVGTSTTAVLDVTGTSSHVGNATFNANVAMGTSSVSGTATAATVAITGTSSQAGAATFAGHVGMATSSVSGTSTMAVLAVTGTSSYAGNAIFNANVGAGTSSVSGTSTAGVFYAETGFWPPYQSIVSTGTTTLGINQSGTIVNIHTAGGSATIQLPGGSGNQQVWYKFHLDSACGTITFLSGDAGVFGGGLGNAATSIAFTPDAGTGPIDFSIFCDGTNWIFDTGGDVSFQSLLVTNNATVEGSLVASGNDAMNYNGATNILIPSGTSVILGTWTKLFDRLSANFNASNGFFTAPGTGYYQVSGNVHLSGLSTSTVGSVYSLEIVKANSGTSITGTVGQFNATKDTASNVTLDIPFSIAVVMTPSQALAVQLTQSNGVTGTTGATALNNTISILQIP